MTHRDIYTYSQLSAESAARYIASHYKSVNPAQCKFYVLGLHDNYLVEAEAGKYILRIYRNAWRSPDEVLFELELLAYLRGKNAPVAWPIPTTSGDLAFRVESPEGVRLAALFHYAEGEAPEEAITIEQCELLGRAVSAIHSSSSGFTTTHQRPELDMHYLINDSIESIKPFIDAQNIPYLTTLQHKLCRNWPDIPKQPETYGICTGDVNLKNFHINPDGQLTLFDFDQCGYGYRAFEIGKFASSLHTQTRKHELLASFIRGYQNGRHLSQAEYHAIGYFELVAVLWVMSIHAKNADRIGYKYLEKSYWDRKLNILKELESRL